MYSTKPILHVLSRQKLCKRTCLAANTAKKSDPVYFDFTFLIKNVPSMSPRPPLPLLLLLSQPPDGSRGLSTAAVSRKKCCNFHRFSFCPSGHCHPTTRRSFNFLSGRGSLGRSGRSLVGNNVLPVLLARDEHGRTGDKDVEFQKLQNIIVQRSTSHYFSVQCHEISYGEK